jgi:hypothetical protein
MFTFARSAVAIAIIATVTMVSAVQAGWERERYTSTLEDADAQRIAASINAGEVTNWRTATVTREIVGGTPRFHVFAERFTPDQPPIPPVIPNPTTINGNLAPANGAPRGINRHTVKLIPGRTYTIEVQSGTGATREVNNQRVPLAGFIDSVVLVEDENGRTLPNGSNDDIAWPTNCNAGVTIVAPASGNVRIVVSSFAAGEAGPYVIQMRPQ